MVVPTMPMAIMIVGPSKVSVGWMICRPISAQSGQAMKPDRIYET